MSYNIHEGRRKKYFVDENVFRATRSVLETKARYMNIEVVFGKWKEFLTAKYDIKEFCGILVQSPSREGIITDFTNFFEQIKAYDETVVKSVSTDLLALTVTKPPGEMGADICFGSSQRLGIPMGFGGPCSGFYATKKKNIRKMPGRIIGVSKDAEGNLAYRMALQTREQHIRREKATSNICTAQALLANISAMYAVYHGPKGLREIANRINNVAQMCESIFDYFGFDVLSKSTEYCDYFDTITIRNCDSKTLSETFLKHEINIRTNTDTSVSLSFNELTNNEDLVEIISILSDYSGRPTQPLSSF